MNLSKIKTGSDNMARVARLVSDSGYYHVMARGVIIKK